MQSGSIAKRYARALIELARESGQIESVLNELEAYDRYLRESEMLRLVMVSPSFTREERMGVLRELLRTAAMSDLTNRFLLLLGEKHRMDVFEDILREYRRLFDAQQGLIRVTVTSAVPLPADLEKQLVGQIESMVNRRVVLTKVNDPSILGGLKTRVGDVLFDGSLSTQLARIRTTLLQEQLS